MSEEQFDSGHDDLHRNALMEMFEDLSFKRKLQKTIYGLKQPKDSGAHKYAMFQIQRLWAPVAAIIVPFIAVGMLMVFAQFVPDQTESVQVKVVEPDPVEDLEEIEELEDERIEPPEPVDFDMVPDVVTESLNAPTPDTELSPKPADFDTVAMVKAPVVMKGIYQSRSPGARGKALNDYGGSGITEGAVIRALRWLKTCQEEGGQWYGNSGGVALNEDGQPRQGNSIKAASALTGMALLAYLAHGDTPTSPEFGRTVEKAIQYLVESQMDDGRFKERDSHDYSLPIATYALCEAYALTRVPMVKYAAEKSLKLIVDGQNPSGGWNYNCKPSGRNDTSYMGWCAQALKAAKMAGISVTGIDEAFKKAVDGFRLNGHPDGGFGYTDKKRGGGLTGVGTLCMQLLGHADDPLVQNSLTVIQQVYPVNWAEPGKGKVYYWYYNTQAMFHQGGEMWQQWNNQFALELVKNQTVIKDGIEKPDGEMAEIGYWDAPLNEPSAGRVQDTCLCALQLEVYYRYLPTFKTPDSVTDIQEPVSSGDEIEVQIDITI